MSNLPKAGAVIFAKNVDRIARFYEHLLAMTVVHAEAEKVVLESEAVLLVIHGIPQLVADTLVINEPPTPRAAVPVKLLLPVPSLAEARLGAPALGGWLAPATEEWTAGTFRACDGADPEGNIVQFRELAPRQQP